MDQINCNISSVLSVLAKKKWNLISMTVFVSLPKKSCLWHIKMVKEIKLHIINLFNGKDLLSYGDGTMIEPTN